MHADEQYVAAVTGCEAAAKSRGHHPGAWYQVDERLHASLCEVCGDMVYLVRPGHEERWRSGGTALEQACPEEEDREAESGA